MPTRSTATARSPSLATTANGAVGMPFAASHSFSRTRCCVVCSTVPLGRTSATDAAAAVADDETFSNSKVTTSTLAAKAATASASS